MKTKRLTFFSLILFLALSLSAQTSKKITIIVKDHKNKPVPGAIILFDNVKQKRWTNSKGIFKIKTSEAPKLITAFSPQKGIKKIKYNGKKKIKIIIPKGNNDLLVKDTNNKKIGSEQFWTIYDYLRGNIPGVNISSDNVVTIRGYGTVNGNTTPLFLLNNTQIDQDTFGQLRPNMIKSIKVIKGPETAVYGSRGAHGVIIVKTL